MDIVVINKRSYELPKKTLMILEKIQILTELESQLSAPKSKVTPIDCIRAEYDFLNEILGEQTTSEILSASNIDEADVNDVSIAVANIINAYSSRMEKEKMRLATERLTNDPNFKRISDLVNTAKELK